VGAKNGEELETALSQAALQDFQVLDADGKVIATGKPGEMISLPPGDYQLRLEEAQHAIKIDSARTTVYQPE
jgi:hypothetical protein